jgi:hypothetical protein
LLNNESDEHFLPSKDEDFISSKDTVKQNTSEDEPNKYESTEKVLDAPPAEPVVNHSRNLTRIRNWDRYVNNLSGKYFVTAWC